MARTLEAALEGKLTAVRTAENQLAAQRARRPVTLTEEETAWITTAGADLRAIFDAPATTNAQRKELIRAVITEIVVTVGPGRRRHRADLPGADHLAGRRQHRSEMPLPASGQHGRATSEDTIDLVRRLALHYDDTTIAQILGSQDRRTATGLTFTKTHVSGSCAPTTASPDTSPPPKMSHPAAMMRSWSPSPKPEAELGVSSATLYRWLREGFVTGEQLTPGAPWRIRIDQQLRDRIRPRHPTAGCPSTRPPPRLGVARQTVLHKVQRGELNAIHVTQRTPQRPAYPGRTRPAWTV